MKYMVDVIIAFLLGGFVGVFIGILMMALFTANKGGGYDKS